MVLAGAIAAGAGVAVTSGVAEAVGAGVGLALAATSVGIVKRIFGFEYS